VWSMKIGALALGLVAWSFLEYFIHGCLAHLRKTPVSRIHDVHHRDPRAVFTIGTWLPLAIIWITLLAAIGWTRSFFFYSGILAGFVIYEIIHYRLHFTPPSFALEAHLRERHLVHHLVAPGLCLGVSSPVWDLIFGTEPRRSEFERMASRVTDAAPLDGPTNISRLLWLGMPVRRTRAVNKP
jgi:dihydroceramide fatty acyl 2-hydroxylase